MLVRFCSGGRGGGGGGRGGGGGGGGAGGWIISVYLEVVGFTSVYVRLFCAV